MSYSLWPCFWILLNLEAWGGQGQGKNSEAKEGRQKLLGSMFPWECGRVWGNQWLGLLWWGDNNYTELWVTCKLSIPVSAVLAKPFLKHKYYPNDSHANKHKGGKVLTSSTSWHFKKLSAWLNDSFQVTHWDQNSSHELYIKAMSK